MVVEPRSGADKIFIDSSVLIAAAISFHGSARDLLMMSIQQKIQLVISALVIEETERNLSRKAPQALAAFYLLLEILPAKKINPPKSLVKTVAKDVEVKDAVIVAGAIHAQATCLATYDRKHLLNHRTKINQLFGVTVARPDEIINALG